MPTPRACRALPRGAVPATNTSADSKSSSFHLGRRAHDSSHRAHELSPLGVFAYQMFSPCCGEFLILGAAIVFGRLPLGRDPAFRLEPLQSRIQRAELYVKRFV